jgi:DMSO/TMAO reductase YedYZ molybdopterin-dependent catalytic subunit
MRHSWPWALGGAAAAALAIGVGEVVAALMSGYSIIAAIGALVIDLQPPGAKDFVVALFGEADKLALEIATFIGGLLVGALLGIAARRDQLIAVFGYMIFAVTAFAILAREPVFDPLSAVVSVSLAAVTGVGALPYLLPRRRPTASLSGAHTDAHAGSPSVARRGFLGLVGAALGIGALLTAGGRYLTAQLPTIGSLPLVPRAAQRLPPPPPEATLGVADISPLITPNEAFYRIDTRLTIPRLDADGWTIRVHGLVEHELELTYEQLARMPLVERYVTIACVSNEVGGYLVGNAKWTGVPLVDVLERAGVQPDAEQLIGRSFDGWTAGFPIGHLHGAGSGSLVALLMNDEPLPPKHGFPLRLIVPGLFGYVSATKWLSEIELSGWDDFDAYWVPRGWAKEAPLLTQSRIDVPRQGARLPAGPATIAGVAWAPTRGITRVEVQVNDEPWQEARLSQPLSDETWIQWAIERELPLGTATIRVRATDGGGEVQLPGPTPPFPDGARGWHAVQVTVG